MSSDLDTIYLQRRAHHKKEFPLAMTIPGGHVEGLQTAESTIRAEISQEFHLPLPLRGQLVEVWQANAAGRYAHVVDDHDAPLDPNFSGGGRCLTGDDGEYRFITIKPGAYPWPNHPNAWRPNHIHFSVFGRAFTERLVTQMYFPGDPLFEFDPIFNAVRDEKARERLISRFDLELTKPNWALGYRFDIVVGGRDSTPFEEPHVD